MKVLKITAEDQTLRFINIDDSLEALQAEVGGWIEYLPVDDEVAAYINEEGKLQNLPENRRATRFARKVIGIHPHDFIAGNMILIGCTDDGGHCDVRQGIDNEVLRCPALK